MTKQAWCRHYRARADFETCEIGIPYESVCGRAPGDRAFPCVHPEERGYCSSFEPFTQEEIDQENQEVVKLITTWTQFMARETEECFRCGQHVDSIKKVGRSIFAQPCGCRLWQGNIPKAWRKESR